MLPKLGQPTYGWPTYGWPLWPTTLNAPAFFVRFNYATSEVFTGDNNTREPVFFSHNTGDVFDMTAETKGF